ncbi:hypothetical protein Q0601_01300 [Paracoccus onubensis]|uniref:hypothetical protein n=1 Tax=Paracoccus onubensis TaxID=1675788 RepID=UPI00272F9F7D|nr:hypothetical protein [Paracoccus onubensis]MDP0925797.1 hypothetical protein [Paracoccus onubensis]
MIRLSREDLAVFRAHAEQNLDRDSAARFRFKNADEVAHLNDQELLAAIRAARETVVGFGISDLKLRFRFIMLDVFRLPGFWRDEAVQSLMHAETGTADTRFGDVCALIKMAAVRNGMSDRVWW